MCAYVSVHTLTCNCNKKKKTDMQALVTLADSSFQFLCSSFSSELTAENRCQHKWEATVQALTGHLLMVFVLLLCVFSIGRPGPGFRGWRGGGGELYISKKAYSHSFRGLI